MKKVHLHTKLLRGVNSRVCLHARGGGGAFCVQVGLAGEGVGMSYTDRHVARTGAAGQSMRISSSQPNTNFQHNPMFSPSA